MDFWAHDLISLSYPSANSAERCFGLKDGSQVQATCDLKKMSSCAASRKNFSWAKNVRDCADPAKKLQCMALDSGRDTIDKELNGLERSDCHCIEWGRMRGRG